MAGTDRLAEAAVAAMASATAALAAWGAAGGATNALVTEMRWRDAIRHVMLGARAHIASSPIAWLRGGVDFRF